MPDLLDPFSMLRAPAWDGIAVLAMILVPAFAILASALRNSGTSDLTRDELRLLKAFGEQAKGNAKAYLSVEFAAYKAEVDKYETKLRRLKDLGYLQDSDIEAGYLGHRPVWITPRGAQRAEKRR